MKWYGWVLILLGGSGAGYVAWRYLKKPAIGDSPLTGAAAQVARSAARAGGARGSADVKTAQASQSTPEILQDQAALASGAGSSGMLGSLWNSWAGMF